MAGPISKKRKVEMAIKGKVSRPQKKFKKQSDYYSSEDDTPDANAARNAPDFQAVDLHDSNAEDFDATDVITGTLPDVEDDRPVLADGEEGEEISDASNSDSNSESEDDDDEENSDITSNPNLIKKRKRNDPSAFATSMSKILSAKLSTSKRSDPVLSRSKTAIEATKEITDLALEKKAKQKMKDDKRATLEKGRVRDVLGAGAALAPESGREENGGSRVQDTMELEKRLRKTAQRGVVKLFNAVRAAQVKGEEAANEARLKGIVGQGRREERVNEMSKRGFLELIAGGGGV